jgi:hypothetical protein
MHSGNRGGDLLRAISLNAMLIPINLAGAINSLHQLWSGKKIPFQRTPKVKERTAATPIHISAQFGLFLFVCSQVLFWLGTSEWLRSLFFLFYVGFYGYTLHIYIGWHEAVEDLFAGNDFRPRPLLKLFSHKLIVHK